MKRTILLSALIACTLPSTIHAMDCQHSVMTLVKSISQTSEQKGELPHTAFIETGEKSFRIQLPNSNKDQAARALVELLGNHPNTKKLTLEYPSFFLDYKLPEKNRGLFEAALWAK